MKVLSVDFDYFVNVTPPQRNEFFPDSGVEMSPDLNHVTWLSSYALPHKKKYGKLTSISVFTDELLAVRDIIASQHPDAFMLADSHRHAYDFICERADEDVELYNVDFHHDTLEDDRDVHCGNWLARLIQEGIVTKAYWCSRPDSDRNRSIVEEIPFHQLPRSGYDLIYVCRSSWWTPPHLDKYFIEQLARPLVDSDHYGKLEKGLLEDRYSKEFQEEIKNFSKLYPF